MLSESRLLQIQRDLTKGNFDLMNEADLRGILGELSDLSGLTKARCTQATQTTREIQRKLEAKESDAQEKRTETAATARHKEVLQVANRANKLSEIAIAVALVALVLSVVGFALSSCGEHNRTGNSQSPKKILQLQSQSTSYDPVTNLSNVPTTNASAIKP